MQTFQQFFESVFKQKKCKSCGKICYSEICSNCQKNFGLHTHGKLQKKCEKCGKVYYGEKCEKCI